jgi:geranylgeranyl diphosphate synthase type I
MDTPLQRPSDSSTPAPWLEQVRTRIEPALAGLLAPCGDEALDPRWERAMRETRRYAVRPAKRLRPALLLLAHELAGGRDDDPRVLRFAAAVELLHTFLLVHDDVADRAETRRGAAALHRLLAQGRKGEQLAVVAGDHLFACAVEAMLASGLPDAAAATAFYLRVCRETAVGQYLDLDVTRAPLGSITLFQTMRIALLKTARYGFVAPLVVGARLAGAGPSTSTLLERLGRSLGLAFQLRDDLIGLFGDAACAGKPTDGDFRQRKPTFPVIAAYTRAPAAARRELEALWGSAADDAETCERVRRFVEEHGGQRATESAVRRASASARRTLARLEAPAEARARLDHLIVALVERSA